MNIFHLRTINEALLSNKEGLLKYTNCIILYDTDWNDFGYFTKFKLTYIDIYNRTHDIGSLKISYKGYVNIGEFRSLKPAAKLGYGSIVITSEYCSIGETIEYYSNLMKVLQDEYEDVLWSLRDLAVYDSIEKEFGSEPSYYGSLLRESSASLVLEEVRKRISDSTKEKVTSFQYLFHPPYSEIPYEQELIKFDFDNNVLPHRINILVGKNGSGKTSLLNCLSESLSGITGVGSSSQSCIKGKRPIFDRVITISYSAFDDTFRDRKVGRRDSSVSYVYCGIHADGRLLTHGQISENFRNALEIIKKKNRLQQWKDIMNTLLEKDDESELSEDIEKIQNRLPLSSGQRILMSTITETIANIEPGSFVLIDEIELHLHPNAISNVIRMLTALLESFDSYAIIATHSPLIVQEFPSKYIHVMNRIGNTLVTHQPFIECFGENITNIVDEVFDVLDKESNYKSVLRKLSSNHSYQDVIAMFGGNLPMNAMIYLNHCYRLGEQ